MCARTREGGAHTGEAVGDGLERHARDVQREVHGVEQRDGGTYARARPSGYIIRRRRRVD